MKVELLKYDPEAAHLLVYTRQTRLGRQAPSFEEVKGWPDKKVLGELEAALDTIQSSWEFIDYTFCVSGVSRGYTHQQVRTRTGIYAQQSQRAVEMSGFDYVTPPSLSEEQELVYRSAMEEIDAGYKALIEMGAAIQDARGLLPTNVETEIICKFNLRTLSDSAKTRLCYRTQGEYQAVFREMRRLVVEVHPWTDKFIRVACAATGVCAFPRELRCPIKPGIFNPDTGGSWPGKNPLDEFGHFVEESRPIAKKEIQRRWEQIRWENDPKVSAIK